MTPRGWTYTAAAVSVLLGVSFVVGRSSVPAPDVKTVERVVYRDRVVEVVKEVKTAAEVQHVVVYRDRVIKPDGTRVEHEVERTETAKTETAARTDAKTETVEATRVAERTETAHRPDWRVGALVGASLRFDPLALSPTFGAHVERRILGPVWVGVWGLHTGVAGVSLGVEF